MKKISWLFVGAFLFSFSPSHAQENMETPGWEHLFGLSYNYNTTAKFDDGIIVVGSDVYSTEIEFEIENGIGLLYEARRVGKNSWGIALGAEYVTVRKLEEAEVEIAGISGSGDIEDNDGFTTLAAFFHAVYQWDIFYIPFGASLTSIDYKGDGEINGGIGFDFGLGWQLNEKLFVEIMGKTSRMTFEEDDPSYDYGDGLLSTGSLQLKYNFF